MTDYELTFDYFTQQIPVFAFFLCALLIGFKLAGLSWIKRRHAFHAYQPGVEQRVMTVVGLFADVLQI